MAKEKSITELRDERQQLAARNKEITDLFKAEKRLASDAETAELSSNQARMAEIGDLIILRESENRQTGIPNVPQEKGFSLRKAMLQLAGGGVYSDEVRAMNSAGEEMNRVSGVTSRMETSLKIPVETRAAFSATGAAGTGSDLIDSLSLDILPPLRDRLVLAQAGATVLAGLRGNIDIPSYSGSTADWENENDAAKDGGGTFAHKVMSPKRLASIITISRQLLVQDTLGVENMLRSELINSIASSLEVAVLGNHAHSTKKPDGIFTGFAGAAIDMTWDNIVSLETQVDIANALIGNTGYIMHTTLYGKGKAAVKKAAGALGFIIEGDGTMNGYKTLRTNAIANNPEIPAAGQNPAVPANYGIVFGNWGDLIIGQWGALELIVDPYTRSEFAQVRIVVNSYWDVITRRDASFAKALMK
ncbi:MAG: phage major capsid protein [Prevotellaceae bacterium]|jgi:HK97 family phage major capsid protein|nr:phage major capsid protein [Prevotellaceae bacterium]